MSEFNAVPRFSPLRPVAADKAVIKAIDSSKDKFAFVADDPIRCKAVNSLSVVTAALSCVIFNLSITLSSSLASILYCVRIAIRPALAFVASNSAVLRPSNAASVAFIVSSQERPVRAKSRAIACTFSNV